MFNFLTKRGRQQAQHPPSRSTTAVSTLQPAQKMELDARIESLEERLADECARRVELEHVEVRLRQALDDSEKEEASLLVSVRESEKERRQLAARLAAMEVQGEGDVESTANMVRGIFDKAKSEAQRLMLLIFSIFLVCTGYFGAKLVYVKNELVRLSNGVADLKTCTDSARSEVEAVRAKLEEVSLENDRLRQESRAAMGWQEKWQDVRSSLAKTKEENDALRRKVNDLEMAMEMETKTRDEEINKAAGSVLEMAKAECQRMALLNFSVVVLCANFAARCKAQIVTLSRKTRELRQFMNCICTLNVDIQALRKDNRKLSENIGRLRVENQECMETIRLMEGEIQLWNDQRGEMVVVEEQNKKCKVQVEEVKALIAVLLEKNAELNRIVESSNAHGWA